MLSHEAYFGENTISSKTKTSKYYVFIYVFTEEV